MSRMDKNLDNLKWLHVKVGEVLQRVREEAC